MATVTVGTEDYQAFADQDFANVYLGADVLRAASWATRNPDAQGRGLVSAARMMLGLPWVTVPTFDDPDLIVQEVNAMLAADLLAKPALFRDASGASNVKTAKAGSAQVEFFRPVEGGPPLPIDLWRLLLSAGLVTSNSLGSSLLAGPHWNGGGDCRPLGGRRGWEIEWLIAEEDYL